MDRGSKRKAPKLEASGNKKRKKEPEKVIFWNQDDVKALCKQFPKDFIKRPELNSFYVTMLTMLCDRVNEVRRQRFALYNKHYRAKMRALIEEFKKRARAQHDKLRAEFAGQYRTLFKTAQRNFELCSRQIEQINRLQQHKFALAQQNSALAQQVAELQRQLPSNTGEQKGARWV